MEQLRKTTDAKGLRLAVPAQRQQAEASLNPVKDRAALITRDVLRRALETDSELAIGMPCNLLSHRRPKGRIVEVSPFQASQRAFTRDVVPGADSQRRATMKSKSSERAQSQAESARVATLDARTRVNPFVIAGRTSGFDWAVITEREFTGNAEDPETQMTPRPLEQCRAYMSGAVGLRRIAPAGRP